MVRRNTIGPYLLVLSFGSVATGLLIPAMGLLVVSKGYSLFYLGLAMLCYSGTMLLFEVPSGIFCDAKGRRNSYQAGQVLSLLGSLCIFSPSVGFLLLGFSLTGLGRAFGSGSLDALLIEDQLGNNGKLENAMVAMDICTSVSLAVGSFIGGYLLAKGREGAHLCDLVLVVRMALLFFNCILVSFLIEKDQNPRLPRVALREQASLLFLQVKGKPFLVYFITYTGMQGLLLASLESYWQPFLKGLLASNGKLWVLGLVGGMVFVASVAGAFSAKVLLKKSRANCLFLIGLFLTFGMEMILAVSGNVVTFCIAYALIYFLLGIVSVVGGVLFNLALDSSVRSSALSLNSMLMQIGGLIAAMVALAVLKWGSISLYWVLVSGFGCLSVLFLAKPFSKVAPKS
ncbi:Major Facilitator Superfamily transporter [Sphaerochaeta pleomorpha str. Grapes]|uniref:Major Facilitator Superfamily transporter n=1 Tax=Sphaerochaeta pleomorpha (strain ATCC BAA-1885 / DSM 22778 / Grapes) TaxID=158190 RepID=G8QYS6_SPHPG|nr:MFS transporter [Sphaerochaeta pleomorpha]AEV29703.1 Major Facilitator Superfamily transporter [Sphaerochaeta pleomorpha str. Grapes]